MTLLSIGQKLQQIHHYIRLLLLKEAKLMGIDNTTSSKNVKKERYSHKKSIKAYVVAFRVDYKDLLIFYLSERILKQFEGLDHSIEALKE